MGLEAGSGENGVGWVELLKKMNVQHRTSNVQHRMKKQTEKLEGWGAGSLA
jgi:hypothetical protein